MVVSKIRNCHRCSPFISSAEQEILERVLRHIRVLLSSLIAVSNIPGGEHLALSKHKRTFDTYHWFAAGRVSEGITGL
jgi:hypothetical protein